MNQLMSGSTDIASEMNHQSQPQPPATPSSAPKKATPAFVEPKESSAMKIINPEPETTA